MPTAGFRRNRSQRPRKASKGRIREAGGAGRTHGRARSDDRGRSPRAGRGFRPPSRRRCSALKGASTMKTTHESMTDDSRGRSTVTRRLAMNMIVGAAAITSQSALTDPADPIFSMIVMHKKLSADWVLLDDQLEEAELNAAKEHGLRPTELISWRNYTIGDSEIDTRREVLLEAGEIDPATVEQEYVD